MGTGRQVDESSESARLPRFKDAAETRSPETGQAAGDLEAGTLLLPSFPGSAWFGLVIL